MGVLYCDFPDKMHQLYALHHLVTYFITFQFTPSFKIKKQGILKGIQNLMISNYKVEFTSELKLVVDNVELPSELKLVQDNAELTSELKPVKDWAKWCIVTKNLYHES